MQADEIGTVIVDGAVRSDSHLGPGLRDNGQEASRDCSFLRASVRP